MELAKRDHYRERLLAERAHLVNEMNRISESIPEEARPPGEHEIAPSEGVDVRAIDARKTPSVRRVRRRKQNLSAPSRGLSFQFAKPKRSCLLLPTE
jgi:hypothetical protein